MGQGAIFERMNIVKPTRFFAAFWRTGRNISLALLLAFAVAGPATPALAQSSELRSLIEAVRRLELQLSILERNVYQGGGTAFGPRRPAASVEPASAAQLLLRINGLEQELRLITGRLEELENKIAQLADLVDRQLGDIDFRLRSLEEGRALPGSDQAGTGPAPLPGPLGRGVAPPTVQLPDGSPQEKYDYAFSFVQAQQLDQAQAAFEAFMGAHPDDPLAGSSQYWIGQIFFIREQYDPAARAFARGFERYPKGYKVADGLLGLGRSLAQLGRAQNACDTFDLLLDEYPQAPANVRERAARDRAELGC